MFMTEKQVEMLRKQYPHGTRLCCDEMPDDPKPIESGTLGMVVGVDDAGQIMMKWDNGRSLSLIPGVDSFHTVEPTEEMTEDLDEGMEML